MIVCIHPALIKGAYASSRTSGGMRWTRAHHLTRDASLRSAKACSPDPPMLGSSSPKIPGKRRWLSSRTPGRARYKPQNHCAGKAGMFRRTCIRSCAFCLLSRTRGGGCDRSIRLSLRPCSSRVMFRKTRVFPAARMRLRGSDPVRAYALRRVLLFDILAGKTKRAYRWPLVWAVQWPQLTLVRLPKSVPN